MALTPEEERELAQLEALERQEQQAPQQPPQGILQQFSQGMKTFRQQNPIVAGIGELPERVGGAFGVATANLAQSGINLPAALIPGSPPSMVAPGPFTTPKQLFKDVGQAASRAGQAAIGGLGGAPEFQPTPREAPFKTGGEIAGSILSIVAQPSVAIAKGGKMARLASSLDDLNKVSPGTTLSLFQNPSKIFKAFQSKESVRQAYKAAVDAGELIAEDVSKQTLTELVKARRLTPVKTLAQIEDNAIAMISGKLPARVQTVTQYRKLLNAEVTRLGNRVDSLTTRGIQATKELARKINMQELVRRTNIALDKIAPFFRKADKVKASFEAARQLRSNVGIISGLGRLGSAAFGGATQQGLRAPVAAQQGIRQLLPEGQ